MTKKELQQLLAKTGRYTGLIDGILGRGSRTGILLAMTDGPDTKLTDQHYANSAARLKVDVPAIKGVMAVEASGAGFSGGRPVLLFEPHRFSKATKHIWDRSHPLVSYPNWDRRRYPRDQAGRYAQLLEAVTLDVDAGFASASYGKPQILGENYAACGYASPFEFAQAMAFDEETQLRAFESFITKRGLLKALREHDWATFAKGYNGTAYRKNLYDVKLEAAWRAEGGHR